MLEHARGTIGRRLPITLLELRARLPARQVQWPGPKIMLLAVSRARSELPVGHVILTDVHRDEPQVGVRAGHVLLEPDRKRQVQAAPERWSSC